jgi:hypothetical protein
MPFLVLIMLTTFAFAQEHELRTSVERMTELEEAVKSLNEQDCEEDNRAFSKVVSGIPVACGSGEPRDGYQEMKVVDCTRDNALYPGGFRFRAENGHPLIPARSLYADGSAPGRLIEFWSRDHALNETYLYLADTAGGPDSHDVKSAMIILPRKVIPSVKVNGNEIEMTMTTGEKVIFDKRTKAIKSGALREGPADITTDRFKRQPPNVHYNGSGISIRLNHRYEDPFQSSETAEVKQGGRTCKIPRSTLFDPKGKLKTTSDAQFVRVINQSCPVSGNQQSFRI